MIHYILFLVILILIAYISFQRKSNFYDNICDKQDIILPEEDDCNDYLKVCKDVDKNYCNSCDEENCLWKKKFKAAEKIREIYFNDTNNKLSFLRPQCHSKIKGYAVIIKRNGELERIDFLPEISVGQPEHYLHYLEPDNYKVVIKSINEYNNISKGSQSLECNVENKTKPTPPNYFKALSVDNLKNESFESKFKEVMNTNLSNKINFYI